MHQGGCSYLVRQYQVRSLSLSFYTLTLSAPRQHGQKMMWMTKSSECLCVCIQTSAMNLISYPRLTLVAGVFGSRMRRAFSPGPTHVQLFGRLLCQWVVRASISSSIFRFAFAAHSYAAGCRPLPGPLTILTWSCAVQTLPQDNKESREQGLRRANKETLRYANLSYQALDAAYGSG